jgi:hypothetical protein
MPAHDRVQAANTLTAVLFILNALIIRYAFTNSPYWYAILIITIPAMLLAKKHNRKNI